MSKVTTVSNLGSPIRLHTEKKNNNLNRSLSIVRMVESQNLRWAGNVVRKGERCANRIFARKLLG